MQKIYLQPNVRQVEERKDSSVVLQDKYLMCNDDTELSIGELHDFSEGLVLPSVNVHISTIKQSSIDFSGGQKINRFYIIKDFEISYTDGMSHKESFKSSAGTYEGSYITSSIVSNADEMYGALSNNLKVYPFYSNKSLKQVESYKDIFNKPTFVIKEGTVDGEKITLDDYSKFKTILGSRGLYVVDVERKFYPKYFGKCSVKVTISTMAGNSELSKLDDSTDITIQKDFFISDCSTYNLEIIYDGEKKDTSSDTGTNTNPVVQPKTPLYIRVDELRTLQPIKIGEDLSNMTDGVECKYGDDLYFHIYMRSISKKLLLLDENRRAAPAGSSYGYAFYGNAQGFYKGEALTFNIIKGPSVKYVYPNLHLKITERYFNSDGSFTGNTVVTSEIFPINTVTQESIQVSKSIETDDSIEKIIVYNTIKYNTATKFIFVECNVDITKS